MASTRPRQAALLPAGLTIAIIAATLVWLWTKTSPPALSASLISHLKSGDEGYEVECRVLYQDVDPRAWRAVISMNDRTVEVRMPGFQLFRGGKPVGAASAIDLQESLGLPDSKQTAALATDLHANLFRILMSPFPSDGTLGIRTWKSEPVHDPDHWFETGNDIKLFPVGTQLPE